MDQWANVLRQRGTGAGWSGLAAQYFGRIMREAVDRASETPDQAMDLFEKHPDVVLVRKYLKRVGYDFEMVKKELLSYNFEYKKGDRPITPNYFSSGEREIFDFLAGIIATNVRHGMVIIDEPELHLHPRWQSIYLNLFEELAVERNLQFIVATHSPVFVTHETISTVTRIYQRDGASRHIAIASDALPQQTHLIRIVHSHNNERIFFADRVALVEGITDRLMFESLVQRYARLTGKIEVCEVVEVHGKANFGAYAKLLRAIDMPHCIIADLDYCLDVGGQEIKALFETDFDAIDRKVVADKKSKDRASIARAIERALVESDWNELGVLWNYVKGRHRG